MKKSDYFIISKDQIATDLPSADSPKGCKGFKIYNIWSGQNYGIKILDKDEKKNYRLPTPIEWELFKKNKKSIDDAVNPKKTKLT